MKSLKYGILRIEIATKLVSLTDPVSGGSSGVDGYDDPVLELKRQRSGTVVEVNLHILTALIWAGHTLLSSL